MMGTFNCIYETPCGWCTKWDKKCDSKIGSPIVNDSCVECDHKWEPTNSGGAHVGVDGVSRTYTTYRCKYCGELKDF